MSGIARVLGVVGAAVVLVAGSTACGRDVSADVGTNSLTVQVTNLVGAQGSQMHGELIRNVDYLDRAPVWQLLTVDVTGSPFSASDTVDQLPEGEYDLTIVAGSDSKSQAAGVKGQGCEMSLTLGKDDHATLVIDGLNEFGDKGYGPCNATRS